MKFRHNHLTYDTDQLGVEAVEDIARQAAFARDVGRQTLEILGFDPEQEFEKREPETLTGDSFGRGQQDGHKSSVSSNGEILPFKEKTQRKEASYRLEH